MRNLLYLLTFFIVTPITLGTSLFALNVVRSINQEQTLASPLNSSLGSLNALEAPRYGSQVYASLPDPVGKVAGAATAQDARVEIVRQYLAKYRSPLELHAQKIVDEAEKNGLDFRLLVAIAQQESNLCKKIPGSSYNCWGWGIHSKGTLRFESYDQAIETVSQGLKEEYIDKGYDTPEQIMAKYTPSSPGSWAAGINQFLSEME